MKILVMMIVLLILNACGTSSNESHAPDASQADSGTPLVSTEPLNGRMIRFTHSDLGVDNCEAATAKISVEEDGKTIEEKDVCLSEDKQYGELVLSKDQVLFYEIRKAGNELCPSGGIELVLFQDSDQSGSVTQDDREVLTLPSCNGIDGKDGNNAAVSTRRFEQHDDCDNGGMVVATWNDVDGDSIYDEKTDLSYEEKVICDGEGFDHDFSTLYTSKDYEIAFQVNRYGVKNLRSGQMELGTFYKFDTSSQEQNFLFFDPLFYQCKNGEEVTTLDKRAAQRLVIKGTQPKLEQLRKQRSTFETGVTKEKETIENLNRDQKAAYNEQQSKKSLLKEQRSELATIIKRISSAIALKMKKDDEVRQITQKLSVLEKDIQQNTAASKLNQTELAQHNGENTALQSQVAKGEVKFKQFAKSVAQLNAKLDLETSKQKKISKDILYVSKRIQLLNKQIGSEETKYFAKRRAKKDLEKVQAELMNLISEKTLAENSIKRLKSEEKSQSIKKAKVFRELESVRSRLRASSKAVKAIKARIVVNRIERDEIEKSKKNLQNELKTNSLVLQNLVMSISEEKLLRKQSEDRISSFVERIEQLVQIEIELSKQLANSKAQLKDLTHKLETTKLDIGGLVSRRANFGVNRKYRYSLENGHMRLKNLEDSEQVLSVKEDSPRTDFDLIKCSDFHLPVL